MTGKRFEQAYGEMGLFRVKDNKTGKYYKAVLCGNPFTETDKPILDVLNEIAEENEQLQEKLKKYEEIEELKKEDFVNCHNCKHDRSVHDGVALDGMCAIKGLMNLDGYFDVEYHRLPVGTFCPYWELEE